MGVFVDMNRRSFFEGTLGVVGAATVPFSNALGSEAGEKFEGTKGLPISILETWIPLVLLGEPVSVRRITVWVQDERLSRTGLGAFFTVPAGRKLHPLVKGNNRFGIDTDVNGVLYVARPRRVVFPLFEYDHDRGVIIGEEDQPTTIMQRFEAVAKAVRENGFDCSDGFEGGYPMWITVSGPHEKFERHSLSVNPYNLGVDDMDMFIPVTISGDVEIARDMTHRNDPEFNESLRNLYSKR